MLNQINGVIHNDRLDGETSDEDNFTDLQTDIQGIQQKLNR